MRGVFGKGKPAWPKFDVTTSQRADGDVVVTVTQSSAAPALHGCVVEVEVESSTGAKTLARVNFGLHPSSASASTVISLGGGTVQGSTVDPNHLLIDDKGATCHHGARDILIF